MNESQFLAWVTKFALTKGVIKVHAELCSDISETMIEFSFQDGKYSIAEFAHGKDWHRTPEAALNRAKEMRLNKIKSLKEQIAKLEKMTFEVPQ